MSREEVEGAFERAPRIPEDEGSRCRREDVPRPTCRDVFPEARTVIRRTADDRSGFGEDVPASWPGNVLSPAPAALVLWDPGGPLKRPLHLLTTHLRF